MESNKDWTYSIADICFFSRWWDDHPSSVRERIESLISNGQLEFVNGDWVANDEVTVYYEDIIENFRLGYFQAACYH